MSRRRFLHVFIEQPRISVLLNKPGDRGPVRLLTGEVTATVLFENTLIQTKWIVR